MTCTRCGADVGQGARFCAQCGSAQGEPGSTLAVAAPESITSRGERKRISVLFTDIVGSTAHAERMDPEDWKDILSAAHYVVTQAVDGQDGTIAQLLGDGVLSFFGAPLAHEDDPVRAVRAALQIQRGIADLRDRLLPHVAEFEVRAGIHSGLVVVDEIGSEFHREYLAVGDTVNVAARLQSAAEPGTVLVSEATYNAATHAFDFDDLGGSAVKGKT